MKKLMMFAVTLVLAIGASAQTMTFDSEAIALANVLSHGGVVNCIKGLESSKKADFSLSAATVEKKGSMSVYQLKGYLIEGGDIMIGTAELEVLMSHNEWGPTAVCTVK